jgi:hypothetical protein
MYWQASGADCLVICGWTTSSESVGTQNSAEQLNAKGTVDKMKGNVKCDCRGRDVPVNRQIAPELLSLHS